MQQEIETLRATFKEESAKNDNLKRMKVIFFLLSYLCNSSVVCW